MAAYADDGDDLMLALASQNVYGQQGADTETVEAVFAQARDAAASAEELQVDDGWQAVEPEPKIVIGNWATNDGHHEAIGIGRSEVLVPEAGHASWNGHAPVRVNGNGADGNEDEAEEGQPSLFSWAKFMAEPPAKPTGRRRKAQAPALSLI